MGEQVVKITLDGCEKIIKEKLEKSLDEQQIKETQKFYYMLEGVLLVRKMIGMSEDYTYELFQKKVNEYLDSLEK